MYPYLVLLHQAEYHQLLRKGQLQALSANRFIDPEIEPELATWLADYALPLADAASWLLLPTKLNTPPLVVEQTDFDAPIPLDAAAAEQFLARHQPTVSRSWLAKVWEIVRSGSWLQDKAPHGLVLVPRYGGTRPEQQQEIQVAPQQYLRPQDIAEPRCWQVAIPDIADEEAHHVVPRSERLALLHVELLELITAVDHHALGLVTLEHRTNEALAK